MTPPVFDDIDPFVVGGSGSLGAGNRPFALSHLVEVTDGSLSVEFRHVFENPKINAIEVVRFGTGDHTLFGGAGSDRIDGGGRDVMQGGGGRDLILGGKGNDILTGQGGKDVLFFETGNRKDRIADWQGGKDKIQIGEGADGFGDLAIKRNGADAVIAFSNVRVTVEDTAIGDLTAADLMF